MPTASSADATRIAYETTGSGPALVVVDGALCHRGFGAMPTLLPELARHFTVYAYDRRGRGASEGTAEAIANAKARKPVEIEREIEDLQAVLDAAGGDPYVLGISSGAILAMYAVQAGAKPAKLALFEPPLTGADAAAPPDAVARLQQMIAEDRRGDAVEFFMSLVGVPGFFMLLMKTVMRKGWNGTRASAHTLPYDIALAERTAWQVPSDVAASISMPTAVLIGGKSPDKLRKAVTATAAAIPGSESATVSGMSHMIKPKPFTNTLVQVLA